MVNCDICGKPSPDVKRYRVAKIEVGVCGDCEERGICPVCHGTGLITVGPKYTITAKCDRCNGTRTYDYKDAELVD